MPKRKRKGFTLVEIMVVVVIIGLLSALVVPRFIGQSDEAKVTTTRAQISSIESALELFHLNNGFFPTTDQGLMALVEKPTTPPEANNYPQGGYMKKLPQDAWKRDFIYTSPSEKGEYEIKSLGADGREGGDGATADITNWD